MQTEDIQTEEAITLTVELSKDKLLGFRNVDADVTEPSFAEDVAATFNKIGEIAAER